MNKRFLLLDELVDVVVAEILSIDEMYIVCTTTYTVHIRGPPLMTFPFFREGVKSLETICDSEE